LRTENAEEPAGDAYRDIGAFVTVHRVLAPEVTKTLRVRSTRRLLQAFCRSVRRGDDDAVEVRVAVRGLVTGIERNVVLGLSPTAQSCPR
jgi:hypothetical protein